MSGASWPISPALSAMSGPEDYVPHARLSDGPVVAGNGREDPSGLSSGSHSFVFGPPAAAASSTNRMRLGSTGSQPHADSSGSVSSLLRIKMRRGSHSRSYTSLTEAVVSARGLDVQCIVQRWPIAFPLAAPPPLCDVRIPRIMTVTPVGRCLILTQHLISKACTTWPCSQIVTLLGTLAAAALMWDSHRHRGL